MMNASMRLMPRSSAHPHAVSLDQIAGIQRLADQAHDTIDGPHHLARIGGVAQHLHMLDAHLAQQGGHFRAVRVGGHQHGHGARRVVGQPRLHIFGDRLAFASG
jgi:hypothetical protein